MINDTIEFARKILTALACDCPPEVIWKFCDISDYAEFTETPPALRLKFTLKRCGFESIVGYILVVTYESLEYEKAAIGIWRRQIRRMIETLQKREARHNDGKNPG